MLPGALVLLALSGGIALVPLLRPASSQSLPPAASAAAVTQASGTHVSPTASAAATSPESSLVRAKGVGDRLVVGLRGFELDEATRDALREGSIAGLILLPHNLESREQIRRLTSDARRAAAEGGHPTPILCIDQEGGRVDRMRKVPDVAPQESAASVAKKGEEEIERQAREVGKTLADVGLNVNLAPDADLATESGIIGDRSYGSDPNRVAACVRAAVKGYQSAGIQAVIKHYPGHGITLKDTHLTLPVVETTRSDLDRHERVFTLSMRANPGGIMLGHFIVSRVDAERPATLSPTFVRRLKEKVGHAPITFTDAGSMTALASFGTETTRAARALNAGVDVYLTTTSWSRLPKNFGRWTAYLASPSVRNDLAASRVRKWRATLSPIDR